MALSKTVMTSGMMLSLAVGMPGMAAGKSTSSTGLLAKDAIQGALPAGTTRRIFISGHSLTGQPFPDYLAEIAATAGISLQWEMQNLTGSSIRQRLHDKESVFVAAPPTEESRSGLQTDSVSSSAPGTSSRDYEIMVITEQHRVLDSLIWEDTVQSLRDYHDRFIAANAAGKTYFFAPWISLSDRADPREWIIYEREALPVWQCIVLQVNQDLAALGRTDRIQFIPTSWALARLVEHITSNANVAGFQGLDTPAKISAIFSDDVHLSRLGAYYVAAISFSTIYPNNQPTVPPQSLEAGQAEAVHAFANTFMEEYNKSPSPSEEECSSAVSFTFAGKYAAYTEQTYHRREKGMLAARVKRLRDTLRYAWRFRNGLR